MKSKQKGNSGFIKLFRDIFDWEWWDDRNTRDVFIYCLLRANHKENKYMGVTIPRGGFIEDLRSMAANIGVTVRELRTAINHLKSTQDISQELVVINGKKVSMFTVNNYDNYQSTDSPQTQSVTQTRHDCDTNSTLNKNVKNDKNIKNSVCYMEIPTTEGSYFVTEQTIEEYTHTFPKINVESSLKKLIAYLNANYKKQRTVKETVEYVRYWLTTDNEKANNPKPIAKETKDEGYAPTYDLKAYEQSAYSSVFEDGAW